MIKKNAQTSLPLQSCELAVAIPQVMALRLLQLTASGTSPSAKDHEEFHRMWIEKVMVYNESWSAMAAEVLRYQHKLLDSCSNYWLNPWSLFTQSGHSHIKHAHRAGQKVLKKGMAPIHRTTVANAKRLSGNQHEISFCQGTTDSI